MYLYSVSCMLQSSLSLSSSLLSLSLSLSPSCSVVIRVQRQLNPSLSTHLITSNFSSLFLTPLTSTNPEPKTMTDHPPSYTPTLPQILVLPLPDATSWFQGPYIQGEVFVKGLGDGTGGGGGAVGVESLQVFSPSCTCKLIHRYVERSN